MWQKLTDFFVWGASPGTAGCFKKATQTPNAGHPSDIFCLTMLWGIENQ
jgi:hypothetical protein